MRWVARILAVAVVCADSAFAGLAPSARDFLQRHGSRFGLSADGSGELYFHKPVAPGGARLAAQVTPPPRKVQGAARERLLRLLESVGGREPERALAPALESMLPAGMAGRSAYLSKDAEGLALTPAGRGVLMDLLTAEAALPSEGLRIAAPGAEAKSVLDRLQLEGSLKSLAAGALAKGGKAFDGQAAPQMVYELPAYGAWGSLPKSKPGEFYRDPKTGDLHLIVAAKQAVLSDRYRVLDAHEEAAVYQEAALDAKVVARHGGKLVRAVDNLLEVAVPEAEAGALGRALEALGLSAAPSAVMQMTDLAAQALAKPHPVAQALMPLARTVGRLADKLRGTRNLKGEYSAKSAETADLLNVQGLWKRGMTGEGGVIANIDSGVDTEHPDFAGKILAYIDLVQAGVDSVGHGTHTAGTSAGSGHASGGKYKGMAPDAKLVVIQVFGAGGAGASELAILAAMKIAASLPKSIRPDVANMSLGIAGPAGHNLHSTALYAEWLMSHGRLFMAIAAGNSGPKQHTIGAPGNARSVLTVTGVDKKRKFPFFPSRGPVENWPFKDYNKPDVAAVAGGVDRAAPCKYAGGVIAPKSKDENFPAAGGDACNAPDNAKYRFMSGTSMATPAAAGVAEDVIAYLKAKGVPYAEAEVKALILETADDLGEPAWVQGAGLINGERLGEAVLKRIAAGAAVGNVPKLLARELDPFTTWLLEKRGQIQATPLGLMDRASGHLVNTAEELRKLEASAEDYWLDLDVVRRSKLKLEYKLTGTRNL